MKRAAKPAALILIIALVISILPAAASATSYASYEKAVDLKILGLLSGSTGGFDLGRTPTRAEGAVMLVRLLGAEQRALHESYSHPFNDVPSWASSYIGYMYHFNMASGSGNGSFGSSAPLNALQYTAFILRALGYDDKNGDFEYSGALEKAQQLGLIGPDAAASFISGKAFIRDDMVGISYNALNVKLKASDKTLLDKLAFDDKAVYKPAAAILGLFTSDLKGQIGDIDSYKPVSAKYGYKAENSSALFLVIRKFIYQYQKQFSLDIGSYGGDLKKDFEPAFNKAYEAVKQATGVDDLISKWEYTASDSSITVKLTYRFDKSTYDLKKEKVRKAVNKARQIVSSLIEKNMPAFDREKLLHDYIVNNTRYDIKNYNANSLPEDTFTPYGCLVNGVAVCQGYAEAMKLLCDLSAVECRIINGKSFDGTKWQDHVWNLVKLDGDWYHLDVTFDDPIMKSGGNVLTYNYFNLTDSEIEKTSSWARADYPVCDSVRDGYYYRNNLVAENPQEFANVVRKAVEQRKPMVEVKVKDYSDSRYSGMTDIVFSAGDVKKFNYMVDKELGIIRIYNIKYS